MKSIPMRVGILLLGLVACASAAPTTAPTEADRARAADLARQAAGRMQKADLSSAQRELREALSLVPDNVIYLYNLALIQAASDQGDAAVADLRHAAESGFTDFDRLRKEPVFAELRSNPQFRELLAQQDQYLQRAAERILAQLKTQFGEHYLYEADEAHRLVFACAIDRKSFDAIKTMIGVEAVSQRKLLFSHGHDEFVRVVVASPPDFARMERRRGVAGRYDDSSHMLLVKNTGPELRHEFTHVMHAEDQHALNQEHPVWLSEGLATLFEQPRYELGPDGERRMDPGDNWRIGRLKFAVRSRTLIPIRKLLTLDRGAFNGNPDLTYGESGSLLMYLFEHDKLDTFYKAYTAGYATDPTGALALEKVTGMTLEQLQAAWIEWFMPRTAPARLAP